jgi:hypothetical protein
MDLLSSRITTNISSPRYNKEFGPFTNNFYNNNFSNYDKEDFEIRKLINKVDEITNTNYTSYKNDFNYNKNMTNINHNSRAYQNNYFHTIDNSSEYSIDSKGDNIYNNRHYNTLPNFHRNHIRENRIKHIKSGYNHYDEYNKQRMDNKYINDYTNTNPENSVYSNESNENDYHHRRNFHRRKYLNNENNYMRNDNKYMNRAETYDMKYKKRNYLTENSIDEDNKNDLYLKTYNQRNKKLLIYIQHESSNLNYKNRNYFSNNKKYIVDRDNYKKDKRQYYRYNTENDNGAVNILLGNN